MNECTDIWRVAHKKHKEFICEGIVYCSLCGTRLREAP